MINKNKSNYYSRKSIHNSVIAKNKSYNKSLVMRNKGSLSDLIGVGRFIE